MSALGFGEATDSQIFFSEFFCLFLLAQALPPSSDKKWEKDGRHAGKNDRLLLRIFFSLAGTCRVVATTTVSKIIFNKHKREKRFLPFPAKNE